MGTRLAGLALPVLRYRADLALVALAALVASTAASRAAAQASPSDSSPRAPSDSVDPHLAQPERPTVATHAGTVAPGWVEVEFGGQRSESGGITNASTPTTVKFGLAPRLQLELFDNWSATTGRGTHSAGQGDGSVAVKWRILEDAPVLGDLGIQPGLDAPTGAHGITSGTTAVTFLLISSHNFGQVSLDINAGYTHRSGGGTRTPRTSTLWTVSTGVPVIGPLHWTAEISGLPGTGGPAGAKPIVACLTGPTFTAYEWLVFDAGVSPTLRGPQQPYVYAGVTWNIGKL